VVGSLNILTRIGRSSFLLSAYFHSLLCKVSDFPCIIYDFVFGFLTVAYDVCFSNSFYSDKLLSGVSTTGLFFLHLVTPLEDFVI